MCNRHHRTSYGLTWSSVITGQSHSLLPQLTVTQPKAEVSNLPWTLRAAGTPESKSITEVTDQPVLDHIPFVINSSALFWRFPSKTSQHFISAPCSHAQRGGGRKGNWAHLQRQKVQEEGSSDQWEEILLGVYIYEASDMDMVPLSMEMQDPQTNRPASSWNIINLCQPHP